MNTFVKMNDTYFNASIYMIKGKLVIENRRGCFEKSTHTFSQEKMSDKTVIDFFGTKQVIFNYDNQQVILYTQNEGMLNYLEDKLAV